MRRRAATALVVVALLAVALLTAFPSSAATAEARVAAFGSNGNGELGDGSTTDRHTPTLVSGLDGVSSVSAGGVGGGGGHHSLAVAEGGSVYAWGHNEYGELGDGTTVERHAPVEVAVPGVFTAVAAGSFHSLALKSDGTVWAWGNNSCGELGRPGNDRVVSTPAPVRFPAPAPRIVAIVAGNTFSNGFSLALSDDGRVYGWGNNISGQLGNGSVDPGCSNSTPGQVRFAGTGDPPKIRAIAAGGPSGFAGGGHSLGLGVDGTVYAWGDNYFGQLGIPPGGVSPVPLAVSGLSGASAIAAGGGHSLAVSDAKAYAWGANTYGQLGYDTPAGQSSTPTKVKKADGTDLDGVEQLAGGTAHTLALASNGKVWGWGASGYNRGQIGPAPSSTPVPIGGFEGAVNSIAAGGLHSLAVVGAGANLGPPSNSKRPSFTGQAKQGETLIGDRGTWSGGNLSFTYQWKRCGTGGGACQDIAGATALDYTLQSTEAGTRVKLVVTASNARGTAIAESDLSDVVAAAGDMPPPCQDSSAASAVDVHGVSGRRGGCLLSRIRALAAGRWDGARRGGRVRVPAARPAGAWGRVCRGVRRWRRG